MQNSGATATDKYSTPAYTTLEANPKWLMRLAARTDKASLGPRPASIVVLMRILLLAFEWTAMRKRYLLNGTPVKKTETRKLRDSI